MSKVRLLDEVMVLVVVMGMVVVVVVMGEISPVCPQLRHMRWAFIPNPLRSNDAHSFKWYGARGRGDRTDCGLSQALSRTQETHART